MTLFTYSLSVHAEAVEGQQYLLTQDACLFLADLHQEFEMRRQELLQQRASTLQRYHQGLKPDFIEETRSIRESSWQIASIPEGLTCHRVQITSPAKLSMATKAMTSGSDAYMIDFEDSLCPTWLNLIQGQLAAQHAVNLLIDHNQNPAVKTKILAMRPRGWHLDEPHIIFNEHQLSGALFDFGLYFFHNAQKLLDHGYHPFFYLPKLEGHLDARLWNDIFNWSQDRLGFDRGTIRAVALIETLPAAFEMHEILYELKDHAVGLNAGRWDYIFSCIKTFALNDDFCLADRKLLTMNTPFMQAYAKLLIQTCHQRGALALGGMSAFVPIKDDPEQTVKVLQSIAEDKKMEANLGFDGAWITHPALLSTVINEFNAVFNGADNQVHKTLSDSINTHDLLNFEPKSPITYQGLVMNVNVSLHYIGAWLIGNGCSVMHHLMEDLATAEIARAQLWQWIKSPKGVLEDRSKVTVEVVEHLIEQELERIKILNIPGDWEQASLLLSHLCRQNDFSPFLSLVLLKKNS